MVLSLVSGGVSCAASRLRRLSSSSQIQHGSALIQLRVEDAAVAGDTPTADSPGRLAAVAWLALVDMVVAAKRSEEAHVADHSHTAGTLVQ
jgi:hypothetical protein